MKPGREPNIPNVPDIGCEFYPVSCLTCPFVMCRFEEADVRAKEVKRSSQNGMSCREIDDSFGLSIPGVTKILRKGMQC